MIEHQYQPSPKSCGQTCLAMLLGVPAPEVIRDIPDTRATSAGELCAYLVVRGWTVTRPTRYRGGVLPRLGLARIVWADRPRATGHWVLFADGRCYDPGDAGLLGGWAAHGGRVASIVALAPPDPPKSTR